MDDDSDFEVTDAEFVLPAHKMSPWLILGAVFEMFEGILASAANFWGALSLSSLAHFKHVEAARAMHDEATVEIETLIGE